MILKTPFGNERLCRECADSMQVAMEKYGDNCIVWSAGNKSADRIQ